MKRKIRWTYMFNQKIAPANFMICRVIVVYEENNFSFVLGINEQDETMGECMEIANKYLFKSRKDCLKGIMRLFKDISEVAMTLDDLYDEKECPNYNIYYYDGFSTGYGNMLPVVEPEKIKEIKKKLKLK